MYEPQSYQQLFFDNGLKDCVIPLKEKRPMISHKPIKLLSHDEHEKRKITYEKLGLDVCKEYSENINLILKNKSLWNNGIGFLLKDLIVIDYDTKDPNFMIPGLTPDTCFCPVEETTKGYHFFFKRTPKCQNTVYDGDSVCRKLNMPIDIKTICKSGTGGIICVYPSPNRKWIKDIFSGIPDIPDFIVDFLVENKITSKLVDADVDDRNTWMKVGVMHKSKEWGFDRWCEWSEMSDKFSLEENQKAWDSFSHDSLQTVSKYKMETFSEFDIANLCMNLHNNKFVNISEKNPIFYFFNGVRWESEGAIKELYNFLNTEISEELKLMNTNESLKVCLKIKGSMKQRVIDEFGKIIFDPYFVSKLDSKVHLIGFDDGVYDFSINKFRISKPEDCISKSVGYCYNQINEQEEEERKLIDKFYSEIYPILELKQYMLIQHSQMLYGGIQNSIVHFHSGSGGNGKSLMALLMQSTLGQYATKLDSYTLCTTKFMDPNSPDPQKLALKGVRYCYLSEPPPGALLNAGSLKDLSGGEPITARTLYSKNRETFNPQFKINVFVNDGQGFAFDGSDGGLERRIKMIKYISKFQTNPIDPTNYIFKIDEYLLSKLKKSKCTHMKILLENFQSNYEYSCPLIIQNWTNAEIDMNNDIKKFVEDFFVFTNNDLDFLTLKDIKSLYISHIKEYSGKKIKTFKEDIQKYLGNIINQKRIGNERLHGIFLKWKIREN